MRLLFLIRALILLLTSAATFEVAAQEIIKCPSIETVRSAAQALDVAEFVRPRVYTVRTSAPAFHESNLDWEIKWYEIPAESASEAIDKAREDVAKTIFRWYDTAVYDKNKYVCVYEHVIGYPISVFAKGRLIHPTFG